MLQFRGKRDSVPRRTAYSGRKFTPVGPVKLDCGGQHPLPPQERDHCPESQVCLWQCGRYPGTEVKVFLEFFCTWLNKPQAIWTNLFMCSSLSPVYLPVNIFDYLLPVIYVQHYVASFHLPINIFLLTFSICKTSTFSCAFAQYVSKKEDQKELKLYRTVNTISKHWS